MCCYRTGKYTATVRHHDGEYLLTKYNIRMIGLMPASSRAFISREVPGCSPDCHTQTQPGILFFRFCFFILLGAA